MQSELDLLPKILKKKKLKSKIGFVGRGEGALSPNILLVFLHIIQIKASRVIERSLLLLKFQSFYTFLVLMLNQVVQIKGSPRIE